MKVFVAGPRAIAQLDGQVKARLDGVMKKELTVLVGDASGVDSMIQNYLSDANYKHVFVYASAGKPRNNVGRWPVIAVDATGKTGFAFYAAKDMAMAADADYGFMIWNGVSKGTLNNIITLTGFGKKSLIYFTPIKDFICVSGYDKLDGLVNHCGDATVRLCHKLRREAKNAASICGNKTGKVYLK